jgi:glycosyltransferase 2 family protein
MTAQTRSLLSSLLKAVFGLTVIGLFIYSGKLDIGELKQALQRLEFVAPIVLLFITQILIQTLRWKLLLRGQGIHLSYLKSLQLTYIGLFFNTVIPGSVTGDIVKGYYAVKARPDHGKTAAFAAILLDRIVGVSGLLGLSVGALFFFYPMILANPKLISIAVFLAGLFLSMVLFFAVVFLDRKDIVRRPFAALVNVCRPEPARGTIPVLGKRFLHRGASLVLKVYDAVCRYRHHKTLFAASFLISVTGHLATILNFTLSAAALGYTSINAAYFFFLTPIGLLTTAIPISPAGIGVAQGAFALLFATINAAKAGINIISMCQVIQISVFLLGIFFWLGNRDRKQIPA